jgi:hypothetical protein
VSAVCTEWAARHGRVRLALPGRDLEVFTVADARGEARPPVPAEVALAEALAVAWLLPLSLLRSA